ncbi:uncharacterized protein LOC105698217 [Orussus abietinus]|uniref:uncharacterized protein LOC105698217 n=1 Tax=Orussus abietinus TaxID=222816 RepID=UPI00062520F2|nr:uncharacterized protein LOC105698217 [Orussus abietinus]
MEYNKEGDSVSLTGSNSSITSNADGTSRHNPKILSEDDTQIQLLKEAMSETVTENGVLIKEISELLAELEINSKTLPNDIKEGLQKMCLIIKSEGISEFDETALAIAQERKKFEKRKSEWEKKILKQKHEAVFKRYASWQKKLGTIQEAVTLLENQIEQAHNQAENEYPNHVLLTSKINDYRETISQLKGQLNDMQAVEFDSAVILNKFKSYMELTGTLSELNQSLSYYSDLPPNLLQARALLESKQREYDEINKLMLKNT